MSKRLFLLVALGIIIASSAGIVTMISAQEGLAGVALVAAAEPPAAPLARGALAVRPVYRTGSGALWRDLLHRGRARLDATTARPGSDRTAGLPRRAVSAPSTRTQPPLVSSLSVDPHDENRVAITTTEAVFLSADAGAAWTRLDVKEPLRPNDQLTCVALSPHGGAVAVGTSFHGFFETSDRGAHWIDLSEKIAAMQLGGGNYEEVASVAYSPVDPDLLYFALGFGKGLFAMRRGARAAERVALPAGRRELAIADIAFRQAPGGALAARGAHGRRALDPAARDRRVAPRRAARHRETRGPRLGRAPRRPPRAGSASTCPPTRRAAGTSTSTSPSSSGTASTAWSWTARRTTASSPTTRAWSGRSASARCGRTSRSTSWWRRRTRRAST